MPPNAVLCFFSSGANFEIEQIGQFCGEYVMVCRAKGVTLLHITNIPHK